MTMLDNTRRWRKTKRGVVTNLYNKMKDRRPVAFSLDWLHGFSNCQRFDRLFMEWQKSGYQKQFKPTIDRIDCKKGYSADNVHWLTWTENRYKQTMERRCRKGPVAQISDGEVIHVFRSQREAVRTTGISQGCMSMCLNGKRRVAGGYSWQYANLLDIGGEG